MPTYIPYLCPVSARQQLRKTHIMENNFDYQSVPYEYAHCFNSLCTRKEKCLRHLVAANSSSQYPTLRVVNPHCIPADTSACPYICETRKYHVAWGIKHLFENVTHKRAKSIKMQLLAYFGRTAYYRYYRMEQGLYPKAQAYISQAFKQNGIEEAPQYERYSEEYSFY